MSTNKNLFQQIQVKKLDRNGFDLTHDHKTTLNMGEIIPVMAAEMVPTDKLKVQNDALVRFMPLIAPVMHRMNVKFDTFFVPNRLLWDNWETFINPSTPPADLPAFPKMDIDRDGAGSAVAFNKLHDNFGIPTPPEGPAPNAAIAVSALPFAAYQFIYNEYYRDANLEDERKYKLVDGTQPAVDSQLLSQLRLRAWEHDYFTSALPTAQAGAAVDVPLGNVQLNMDQAGTSSGRILSSVDYTTPGHDGLNATIAGTLNFDPPALNPAVYDPNGSLEVAPTTIQTLRRAFKLQEFLELAMRSGKRTYEWLLAFFNLRSQDYRIQRPEHVNSTQTPVMISEVLNTTGTDELPQGNMAGHGISVVDGTAGSYFANEHGYLITLMTVLPRTGYFQGIPKHFLKFEPSQYFWKQFAHIGEQPIEQQELYAYTPTATVTFGYTPRYSEYKYMPSRICGDLRKSLLFWHLARKFDNEPALNDEFIKCDPETVDRIFAVQDSDNTDHLVVTVINKVWANRPMPFFGSPSL